MKHFLNLVADDIEEARRSAPPIASFHEAYAALAEGLDEFWTVVRNKPPNRTDILCKLAQIAATSMRAAEDTGLLWDGNAREPCKTLALREQQEADA